MKKTMGSEARLRRGWRSFVRGSDSRGRGKAKHKLPTQVPKRRLDRDGPFECQPSLHLRHRGELLA